MNRSDQVRQLQRSPQPESGPAVISACGDTAAFFRANPALAVALVEATQVECAKRVDGEWIEHCDVCGKALDQMKGEDFYDEPRNRVTCAEHWEGNQDGRRTDPRD